LTNYKPDGTTVIDSYEYSYDKAGNMVSKKEHLGNNHSDSTTIERITAYKHDALNRLIEVDEPATVQFELAKKTTSYSYDKAGNRIGEYILEGTKLTSKIYKYNEQNRLMSVVEGDIIADTTKTTKYVYDNNGNHLGDFRIGKATLEWCPGRTQTGNGCKKNWNNLITFFES